MNNEDKYVKEMAKISLNFDGDVSLNIIPIQKGKKTFVHRDMKCFFSR